MNPSQLITLESSHEGGEGAFIEMVAPNWPVAPGSLGRSGANWQPEKFSNHWGLFFFQILKKNNNPHFSK